MFDSLKNFFWDNTDSDAFSEEEEKHRKFIFFKNALIIATPITLTYSIPFYYNEVYENALIQFVCGLLFIALLLVHLKTHNTSYWVRFYGLIAGISIYATIYYTGGLFSNATAWIITHAPVAILLAGKRNGVFWLITDFVFLIALGILHNNGHVFPSSTAKYSSALNLKLQEMIPLLNFMFLLSIIFENGKNRALRRLNDINKLLYENNILLSEEKARSENLLRSILPEDIVNELKAGGVSKARRFDSVSVLFTDFVNFTGKSEKLDPEVLVNEIDTYFKEFDNIIDKYGLEKIKTIGDAYMAVSGLPHENKSHALATVNAARDIITFIESRKKEKTLQNETFFDIRIGISSGSVVAGIVGNKKFAYDIWGDTVNTASRMEQASEPGRINITEDTFNLVKDYLVVENRGTIEVKNKGLLQMYFVKDNK